MNLWALQDFFLKNCIFFDTISFCCFAQVRHCIFVSFFLYIILPIIFYDKRNRPPGCSHVSMGLITAKSLSVPRCSDIAGAYFSRISCCAPPFRLNYYPCQGQSALSMPNFNEASLSDTLQLVYSYKILWETGSLIPFYIGHYYNNQSSHQWLLLLRKKLPISLI